MIEECNSSSDSGRSSSSNDNTLSLTVNQIPTPTDTPSVIHIPINKPRYNRQCNPKTLLPDHLQFVPIDLDLNKSLIGIVKITREPLATYVNNSTIIAETYNQEPCPGVRRFSSLRIQDRERLQPLIHAHQHGVTGLARMLSCTPTVCPHSLHR